MMFSSGQFLKPARCESTSGSTLRGCLFVLFFPTLLLTPVAAPAQNSQELRNLVFDPVLIETTIQDEELIVTELGSLPSSDHPTSASEHLVTEAIKNQEEVIGNIDTSVEEYEARIRDLELAGGAYEQALSQEMLAIASLYQSTGEHETALEYLDQALHINRVNLGLFNLEQEEIINEQIKSYVSLGDLAAADAQQEYLFFLKRRAYGGDSVEMLPALAQYAEWNIFAFDSSLAMDPELAFAAESGFNPSESTRDIPDLADDFKTIRLINAHSIYRTMLQILLNNFGVSDPRLLEVEERLVLTNYFFATNLTFNNSALDTNTYSTIAKTSQGFYDMPRVSTNSMGYRLGRDALERRLEYLSSTQGVSAEEVVRAMVDLADWLMVFKKRSSALDTYEQAYAQAIANNIDQDVLEELFYPALPQTVPTFIDYRHTRAAVGIPEEQPLDYQGWIDVSLRLNRFGNPADVEILDKSPETSDPIESQLYRLLRNSTSFRPRFKNDALLEEDTFSVRYYFTY